MMERGKAGKNLPSDILAEVKRLTGGNAGLALKLSTVGEPISPNAVSKWVRVPESKARAVARITGLSLHALRPDIWAKDGAIKLTADSPTFKKIKALLGTDIVAAREALDAEIKWRLAEQKRLSVGKSKGGRPPITGR